MSPTEILTRLDTESSQLFAAFFGLQALQLLGLLGLLWLVVWGLRALIDRSTRLPAASRTLGNLAVQTVALVATVLGVVWHFYRSAPHFVELFVAAGLFSVSLGVSVKIRSWLSGLTSIFRGRIRAEDRLTVGDVDGIVTAVGLFRVVLRSDTGGLIYLPVNRLAQGAFSVATPKRMYPVEVQLDFPDPVTEEILTRFERVGCLCPYRQAESEVIVDRVPNDDRRVVVRFRAWSNDAADRAKTYLHAHAGVRSPGPVTKTIIGA